MNKNFSLDNILQKATIGESLSNAEIIKLLGLSRDEERQQLFATARELRHRYFQNKVFLYGFVYFSTWCKNECTFCAYRRTNTHSKRYRKTAAEIAETVANLQRSGVHLVDLTMGEDPFYHKTNGFANLLDLIRQIKDETKLPVMISPGVIPEQTLKEFVRAGVDWFACYQETFNKKLFTQLRINQSFQERLNVKNRATQAGLLIEEGILLGIGETLDDIALAMEKMRAIGAHQVRAMSFVPQKGIPLENVPSPDRRKELVVIAVLRLLFPDKLIPASLDIDGIEGLTNRLAAGANVVTSLIPPNSGFAGVAQCEKDINEGHRTVAGVLPVLRGIGLEAADIDDYRNWIESQKNATPYQLSYNNRRKT